MEWSKAKSILLLLMLAANIYLGGNIIYQLGNRSRQERQMIEGAYNIVTEQGIEVDEQQLLDMPQSVNGYVFSRDISGEQTAAEALLGPCKGENPGGGIYSYTSQKGQAVFRSGGYFQLSWDGEGSPDLGTVLGKKGQNDLKGLETDRGWELYMGDSPVLGAAISQDPDGGYSGSWVFGSLTATETRALSRPDMILAMGRVLASNGMMRVDGVESAFVLTAMQNGDVRLTPVWMVESGRRTVYISVLSGETVSY